MIRSTWRIRTPPAGIRNSPARTRYSEGLTTGSRNSAPSTMASVTWRFPACSSPRKNVNATEQSTRATASCRSIRSRYRTSGGAPAPPPEGGGAGLRPQVDTSGSVPAEQVEELPRTLRVGGAGGAVGRRRGVRQGMGPGVVVHLEVVAPAQAAGPGLLAHPVVHVLDELGVVAAADLAVF